MSLQRMLLALAGLLPLWGAIVAASPALRRGGEDPSREWTAPRVKVLALVESACPYCQSAMVGPLTDLLKAPGIEDIIDFQYHPFGNSFYETPFCGGKPYSVRTRHCWAQRCVGVPHPHEQCFNGSIVAQHGPLEAHVNRVQTCAKKHASTLQAFWRFAICMEGSLGWKQQARPGWQACSKGEPPLDFAKVWRCYSTAEGDEAVSKEAKATIDHPGVPYLAVNGQEVGAGPLLPMVCQAYRGSLPSGCAPFAALKQKQARELAEQQSSVWQ